MEQLNFKRANKWLKVKIKEDGYKGYVIKKRFSDYLKPTHKISVLKSKVYKSPNKREQINQIFWIENKSYRFKG